MAETLYTWDADTNTAVIYSYGKESEPMRLESLDVVVDIRYLIEHAYMEGQRHALNAVTRNTDKLFREVKS